MRIRAAFLTVRTSVPIQRYRIDSALQGAFSLLELIGVLAIVAILAAVVLPSLIKETDYTVATQEGANLQSFADAFQRSVTSNRRIPGGSGNDWATNIAAQLGLDMATVTNNARRLPRIMLIDTNGFGALTLPYAQTNTGTLAPTNSSFAPRLMFISTLGLALPANMPANGLLATSDFTNLWNWDGTSSHFPTTGIWSGWRGSPSDITVQRVNLSKLFVNLWLSYNVPNRNTVMCSYAVDYTNNAISSVSNSVNYIHGYFIRNSVLSLYYTNLSSNLATDSVQILTYDSSFVFDQNKWFNSLGNATNVMVLGGGGGSGIANFDFTDMVNGFLDAPSPFGSLTPSALQTNVVQSFIQYMTDYTNWAAAGWPNPSALYTSNLNDQVTMMNYTSNLINSIVVH